LVAITGSGALRARSRDVVRGAAWIVAGALPYVAWRVATGASAADTIHTERQGLLSWGGPFFTMSPHWILWGWGGAGILALAIAFGLLRGARRSLADAFLASGMLGAANAVANPLVTPILHRAIGYLVLRFTWFAPHVLVLARVLRAAIDRLRAGRRRALDASFVAAGLALLVAAGAMAASAHALVARARTLADPPVGFARQTEAFAAIDAAIPAPSVILSDPATGYAIPALTRHYTVSASAQHTPPGDPDARARLRDTRRALSPYVDTRETIEILRRHGAGWVLVNAARETQSLRYLVYPTRASHDASRAKLDASPELFERVAENGGLALYRLSESARSGPLPPAGDAQRPLPERPLDAAAEQPADEPGFLFLGGSVISNRVERGGEIAIRTRWARTQDAGEENRHLLLRLHPAEGDAPTPLGSLAVRAGRLAGLGARERSDVRIAFAPGDGFLPPNDWPLGRAIEDETRLALPRALRPGRYAVRVELVETPFYPNVTLGELLSPATPMRGFLLGEIEVTPQHATQPE
jgi:hypothetical protein